MVPSPRRAALAVAVLALLASPLAIPTADDGPLSQVRRAWRGDIEPAIGFTPALCSAPVVAPELLALADWPLDADGQGCRVPGVDARPVPVEEVLGHPPVLAVTAAQLADEAPPSAPPASLALASAVDEDELSGLRGGFELPGGLVLSFGLERLVYINGVLTSTTRLTVAQLGELIAGSAAVAGAGQSAQTAEAGHAAQSVQPVAPTVDVGSTLAVIQNGPGNVAAAQLLNAATLGTVIQNSLDDQRMQIITTVNARVNSMELLRADRLGESIRNAINLR